MMRKTGLATLAFMLFLFISGLIPGNAFGLSDDHFARIYYLYEVNNQIPLSEFELGSAESIRDRDGNGAGLSLVLKKGNNLVLEFDMGYSRTVYMGAVEDGVNITFLPQTGSGFETISSSKNVVYNFDVAFENPYVGLNLTFHEMMRVGGGRVYQSSKGQVSITAQDIEIINATFDARTQLYFQIGFNIDVGAYFFTGFLRSMEAPQVKIQSCNELAVGALNCSRIKGVIENRNLKSNKLTGGVLQFGLRF
ncbi:MAG: hypothetical protein OEY59_02260 [Deltaproteobacteria bacterium]|nr:hypothetical protein [Deltaproteobacteria bacterium]